jgi:hypothetical protein
VAALKVEDAAIRFPTLHVIHSRGRPPSTLTYSTSPRRRSLRCYRRETGSVVQRKPLVHWHAKSKIRKERGEAAKANGKSKLAVRGRQNAALLCLP